MNPCHPHLLFDVLFYTIFSIKVICYSPHCDTFINTYSYRLVTGQVKSTIVFSLTLSFSFPILKSSVNESLSSTTHHQDQTVRSSPLFFILPSSSLTLYFIPISLSKSSVTALTVTLAFTPSYLDWSLVRSSPL